MKRSLLYFLVGMFLLGACNKPEDAQQANSKKTPRPDVPTITEQDVQERLGLLSEQDAKFAQTPIGRQNLLQIILREKLIQTDALAQGLDQSADYQKLSTDKRMQLNEIYQAYTRQLLEDVWYEKQRQSGALQVTDEEIANYYKKYPYEMTVQQIIVDNAETADQVLRTLKRSPSKWKEMSRQYNVAPEEIRNTKFTFMPGEFLPEIEVIAATSSNGSVQGFIKTVFGFHIIMKTNEKRLSKSEAEPRIRAVLENKKLDEIIANLQNKYEVMIYAQNE